MHPATARNPLLACFAVRSAALLLCVLFATAAQGQGFRNGVQDALGPLFRGNPYAQRADNPHSGRNATPQEMVRHWNEVAIDASGLDHTPVADGEARLFGEQLGPARASRAMAIVHIAIFDAVNAIAGRYRSYTGIPPAAPRRHLDGRRDRAGGARHAGRPVPVAESDLRRRSSRTTSTPSTAGGRRQRGIDARATRRRRDPAPARERRIGARRTARRHRVHHEPDAGQVAPGPDQPESDRARCLLGRGHAVRPAIAARSFARRRRLRSARPSTRRRSTR